MIETHLSLFSLRQRNVLSVVNAWHGNNLLLYCLVQVTIEPEVSSNKLNKAIMTQLVKLHRDTDLGKRLPVYDGREALYTAGVLPFTSKEFTISLAEEDEGLGIIRYIISTIV